MKTYSTMITKDYVPDWSVCNGIREFLANALDSSAPFEYTIGNDYIEITSVGMKLDVSCLLLGKSENRNKSSSVGTHGEGLVISQVPLLREGKSLIIANDDVVWTPSFQYRDEYGMEILVIEETTAHHPTGNYSVIIGNLTSDEIDEVKASCLYLQEDLGDYATAPCGSRVFYDRKGELYVGGLFVCKTQLSWSYDLHPSKIKLNRDRKVVDEWSLQGITAGVLRSLVEEDEIDQRTIVDLAATGAKDTHHMRYSSVPNVGDVAYDKFKNSYGDKAIPAKSWVNRDDLISQGYVAEDVVVVNSEEYYQMIVDSEEYQEYISSVEVEEPTDILDGKDPVDILQEWYDKDTDWNMFEKILDKFKERGVRWDD